MTASTVELADDPRSHRDRFVGANYWQAMNLASRGPGGDRQHQAP